MIRALRVNFVLQLLPSVSQWVYTIPRVIRERTGEMKRDVVTVNGLPYVIVGHGAGFINVIRPYTSKIERIDRKCELYMEILQAMKKKA